MNAECLMKLSECPILWTLTLVWPIEMFIYEMSLHMSLFINEMIFHVFDWIPLVQKQLNRDRMIGITKIQVRYNQACKVQVIKVMHPSCIQNLGHDRPSFLDYKLNNVKKVHLSHTKLVVELLKRLGLSNSKPFGTLMSPS